MIIGKNKKKNPDGFLFLFKNYFSIKEIFSILNIIISNKGNLSGLEHLDNKTLAFMNKIIPDIKNYRKSIPNLAFSEQWFWLSEIINLQKLSFTNKVSYKKINNFFNSLTELLRYAIDYENIFYEAKSYMIVCDEYIAYSKLLDKRFANDFRDFAEESIDNAVNIVKSNKNNPLFYEYFLPTSYYLKKIRNDDKQAKKFLELFEEKKISPHHYALWLKQYYFDLKEVLK